MMRGCFDVQVTCQQALMMRLEHVTVAEVRDDG